MPEETPQPPPVGYQLIDMALLEVSLRDLAEDIDEAIAYGFKIELTTSPDHKGGFVTITVKAAIVKIESEEQIAKISVGYRFLIQNFGSLQLAPGAPLPDHLAVVLNSVAISTTRGVFYSEVRGTNLHTKIMPIIDPTNFTRTES